MKKYDVIVIGSGGGSKITRPAANLGKKVAIIEKGRLGGTCLNHGCIPSKMLIHPADVIDEIQKAQKYGIHVNGDIQIEYDKLIQYVNGTIDGQSNSIAPMYDKHPNIDLYPHKAEFISDKVIDVNGEQLTADLIFVVAGCRPNIPEIDGLSDTPYLTYFEALRLEKRPNSMAVLGAGYIAVELGYFFGMMGVDTTFFVRSEFLRHEDRDIQAAFTESFSKRFNVLEKTSPSRVSHDGQQFHVTYTNPGGSEKTLVVDQLLVATGVKPNSDTLRLDRTGVQLDDRGFVKVDETLQTAVPGVYAFGDILGRYLFRHSANFEGEYMFDTVFGEDALFAEPIQYPPMPHAVFSNPQIGSVGKTEDELEAEGVDYVVGMNSYAKSAMGMALRSDEGFTKLIFDRSSKKLLGAHIIGEEASNIVHMLIAYMTMGAGLDDLLRTIYIHPALPEIVRNAARNARAQFNS